MREPAGQDHDVGAAERRLLVPDELGLLAEHVLRRVIGVVIAVRSRKHDDRELHGRASRVDRLGRQLDAKTLDDRIREHAVGDLRRERLGLAGVAAVEIELEELALPDVVDAA